MKKLKKDTVKKLVLSRKFATLEKGAVVEDGISGKGQL